ncbi:uncharacterized protein DUF4157 [Amycolatopsis sulphurea]|uniref:Uncharacterized protein DUF4157 n=1 Tax=Amycolatopsis sulphurea TaxID=76022 RepID=A0A2A9FJE4_9PSEU|nr:DUF4157 domain-containing protein [Amycolatopsis sulphurea]PFG50682.1 uncharacterized protein DUF4157 [Amycolatopsis sulphurea]
MEHVRVSRGPAPPVRDEVPGTGQPLGAEVRHFLEGRFGQDFSRVRVHTDQPTAGLGAKAYTVGENVVFGSGEYRPGTEDGRRLLAHELAHVVQQRRGGPPAPGFAAGHALDHPADTAADAVLGTGTGTGPVAVAGGSARGLARQADPAADPRVVLGQLPPWVAVAARSLARWVLVPLRLAGWAVTGAAIGLRVSGTVGAGPGVGAGQDTMFFLDTETGELTGDVFGYGELGVGAIAGGSGGVVFAVRLGPVGKAGSVSGAYAGAAVGGSVQLLAGAGLSIGTGLLSGEEGWAAAAFSVGPEAGLKFSETYGVSVAGTVAPAVSAWATGLATRLAAGTRAIGAVGGAITDAVVQSFGGVVAILDPDNWNLAGYRPAEAQAMRELGGYLKRVILATSLDRFLAGESRGVPVSARIAGVGDVGVLLRATEAVNARYRRISGTAVRAGDQIWPADAFAHRTYLQFLSFLQEQRLLSAAAGSRGPAKVTW